MALRIVVTLSSGKGVYRRCVPCYLYAWRKVRQPLGHFTWLEYHFITQNYVVISEQSNPSPPRPALLSIAVMLTITPSERARKNLDSPTCLSHHRKDHHVLRSPANRDATKI
jgi:hypothetical protein